MSQATTEIMAMNVEDGDQKAETGLPLADDPWFSDAESFDFDSPFRELRNPRHRAFLNAYTETATLTRAEALSGVSRKSHDRWRKTDAEYAKCFEFAQGCACDMLEDEVRRRAVHGWDEPVYYRGRMVGTIKRYSDILLLALLRAFKPDRYCPGAREIRGRIIIERELAEERRAAMVDQPLHPDVRLDPRRQAELDELERELAREQAALSGAGTATGPVSIMATSNYVNAT